MPGMIKLALASNSRELRPFQHLGVEQHHLQPHGSHLKSWIFFVMPKYHLHNMSDHEMGLPKSREYNLKSTYSLIFGFGTLLIEVLGAGDTVILVY